MNKMNNGLFMLSPNKKIIAASPQNKKIVQHNFRRTQLPPSRDENISSLSTAVQHNFRRMLLVPSREENISSLSTAVQHNFRRTLLVPSSEESIRRELSYPWLNDNDVTVDVMLMFYIR